MIHEEIPAALAGERLDRIVALITDASRSDAAALVAAGGAQVDGVVTTSGKLRLQLGQRIDVDETKLPITAAPVADPTVQFSVVYDDEHVIVVDKPAGLVVHPGAGNPSATLVNGLLARYPEIAGIGESHRPGIVHRLDVGTSGLMVVARSVRAYQAIHFARHDPDRNPVYRAEHLLSEGGFKILHQVLDFNCGDRFNHRQRHHWLDASCWQRTNLRILKT